MQATVRDNNILLPKKKKKSYFDLPFNRESMMLNFPHKLLIDRRSIENFSFN